MAIAKGPRSPRIPTTQVETSTCARNSSSNSPTWVVKSKAKAQARPTSTPTCNNLATTVAKEVNNLGAKVAWVAKVAKIRAKAIATSRSHPVFQNEEAATLLVETPVASATSLRGPRTRSYPEAPLT